MSESFPLSAMRAEAYQKACAERGAIAFVAVSPPPGEEIPGVQGALGVAIANERGYSPIPLGWARYATWDGAQEHADALNRDVLKLTDLQAVEIVASTMGGRFYHAPKPGAGAA